MLGQYARSLAELLCIVDQYSRLVLLRRLRQQRLRQILRQLWYVFYLLPPLLRLFGQPLGLEIVQ
jgi:hypothetical protein